MNKLSILIENYIKLEHARREHNLKALEKLLNGTDIEKMIAKRLVPKNVRSKMGVGAELKEAYATLIREFETARVFVRCIETIDSAELATNDGRAMTVYTEKKFCLGDDASCKHIELPLKSLIMLTYVTKAKGIYLNEGENSLYLSYKICEDILSGNYEYRFVANDKSLLKYNLEVQK